MNWSFIVLQNKLSLQAKVSVLCLKSLSDGEYYIMLSLNPLIVGRHLKFPLDVVLSTNNPTKPGLQSIICTSLVKAAF